MEYDFLYKTLLGGIIGSYLTRLFNRNREKISLTFDLHKEYNSSTMSSQRRCADKLISEYPDLSYEELEKIGKDELTSVFLVLQYFQRLSTSIEYNMVKKKLVLKLFAEPFYFWHYISYQNNLVHLKWDSSEQMLFLARWFERNLKTETHLRLKKEMAEKLAIRKFK